MGENPLRSLRLYPVELRVQRTEAALTKATQTAIQPNRVEESNPGLTLTVTSLSLVQSPLGQPETGSSHEILFPLPDTLSSPRLRRV